MLYDPKWNTEVQLEPWQKLLQDAATLIERKGWVKNSLERSDGYCMVGALQKTAFGRVVTSASKSLAFNRPEYAQHPNRDAYFRAVDALTATVRPKVSQVYLAGPELAILHFNDTDARDANEIVQQFYESMEKR